MSEREDFCLTSNDDISSLNSTNMSPAILAATASVYSRQVPTVLELLPGPMAPPPYEESLLPSMMVQERSLTETTRCEATLFKEESAAQERRESQEDNLYLDVALVQYDLPVPAAEEVHPVLEVSSGEQECRGETEIDGAISAMDVDVRSDLDESGIMISDFSAQEDTTQLEADSLTELSAPIMYEARTSSTHVILTPQPNQHEVLPRPALRKSVSPCRARSARSSVSPGKTLVQSLDCDENDTEVELRRNKRSSVSPRPVPKPRTKSISSMKARFEDGPDVLNSVSSAAPSSLESSASSSSSFKKSLTFEDECPVLNGRQSAQGIPEVEKKLQFKTPTLAKHNSEGAITNVDKLRKMRLSSTSLHNTIGEECDADGANEEQPLQRRNSIHNVPFVDVNDPQTRERMERYKEERRSLLRAKYKAEDYKTKKPEDGTLPCKSERRLSDGRVTPAKKGDKANRVSPSPSSSRSSPSPEKGSRVSPLPDKTSSGKSRTSPMPRTRYSLQEHTQDFKVPLRQMPVERAPAFKKSSVSDMYYSPSKAPPPVPNFNRAQQAERKWTPTPSPGATAALKNKNNNKERRTPSPKQATALKKATPQRPTQSYPGAKLSATPSGQTGRPSSFPQQKQEEEDVNVKERAAMFGPRKSSGRGQTMNKSAATAAAKKKNSTESAPPGSPSKIKNMAAMFEQNG